MIFKAQSAHSIVCEVFSRYLGALLCVGLKMVRQQVILNINVKPQPF